VSESEFDCVGKPNGNYPNPEDRTKFYMCSNEYAYLFDCPPGTYFDPDTSTFEPLPTS
jgi:hypothetical protein